MPTGILLTLTLIFQSGIGLDTDTTDTICAYWANGQISDAQMHAIKVLDFAAVGEAVPSNEDFTNGEYCYP